MNRTSFRRAMVPTAAALMLGFGLAACGGADAGSGRRQLRCQRHGRRRRLLDRLPDEQRRLASCSARRTPTSRSPSAPPAPAAASRSSAPARPTSPTPRVRSRTTRRSRSCEEGRHRVHRAPGRHRRPDRGRAPRPRGRLPHHRPADQALGSRLQGQQLEAARPELPRPGDLALRSRHRLRHLRLHGRRRDRRRVGDDPRRLRGLRGRQRPGRRASRAPRARPATSATPTTRRTPTSSRRSRSTTARAASSPPPRPLRPASTPRWPARCSST